MKTPAIDKKSIFNEYKKNIIYDMKPIDYYKLRGKFNTIYKDYDVVLEKLDIVYNKERKKIGEQIYDPKKHDEEFKKLNIIEYKGWENLLNVLNEDHDDAIIDRLYSENIEFKKIYNKFLGHRNVKAKFESMYLIVGAIIFIIIAPIVIATISIWVIFMILNLFLISSDERIKNTYGFIWYPAAFLLFISGPIYSGYRIYVAFSSKTEKKD